MRSIVALFTITKALSFPSIEYQRQTIYSTSGRFPRVSLLTTRTSPLNISTTPPPTTTTRRNVSSSAPLQMAKPKSGNIVDSYQTVSVNCAKCRTRLFRYKKKNGTKSNLVKCYIERISEDCVNLLDRKRLKNDDSEDWFCPNCQTRFGKDSMIHGRPAIKLVGGKIQMTKK
jgi:uncharacterized protein YlaI